MASSYEYTEFEFDSQDCTASTSGSTNYRNTPSFLLGKPLDNVAYFKVLEAQIPFSFYLINSRNNTFYLVEYYDVAGVATLRGAVVVTLPVGNYNSTTIITPLQDALNTASAAITTNTGLGATRAYVAAFSSLTGKLTVTTPATAGVNSHFAFSSPPIAGVSSLDANTLTPLGWLGMNVGPAYPVNTQTSTLTAPYTFSFPNLLNLSGPFYVYLNSNKIGGLVDLYLPGNGVVNRQGGGSDGPQLAKIPMVSDAFTVTNWIDPCPEKWFPVSNATFAGACDFFCTLGTDSIQYPIDFNGLGFSFKLGILRELPGGAERPGGGVSNDRVVARTWQ